MTSALQTRMFSPVDQQLTKFGWTRLDFAGPVYQLGQGREAARLESLTLLGGGTRYRLDAPALGTPAAADLLTANAALPGPLKFVDDASGEIACVADLPAATLISAGEFDASAADSPVAAWAECLTALASGSEMAAGEGETPAQITRSLEAAGYTASIDGSGVKATLVLPGRFAEVAIEPTQPSGMTLSLALPYGGQSPAAAAAARGLAREINRRLLLARVSDSVGGLREREPGVLTAEVRLTMSRVHEAWLLAAMESLAAAAGLALRCLAALRDPALAALVIGQSERG